MDMGANRKNNKTGQKEKENSRELTLGALLLRGAMLAVVVLCVVIVLEKKRIFVEDSMNNHTEWRWDWYYRLKEYKMPVDVLFVGNSHLLTGLNPYVFMAQSGMNGFILGSSGVGVADLYYTVEEALKIQKPKLLVLETYAINELEPYELEKGALNDQINSFRARRDTWLKIKSTPALFDYHNWPIAWCETFRNHNYIFTKPDQLGRNLRGEGPKRRVRNDFYLGQFARFSKGLSQTTLDRYEEEGAPVDGEDYMISRSAARYTEKIAELCRDNGVQLVFLTVPMYPEHVENYQVWRDRLGEHISGLSPYWLDLQAAQMTDSTLRSLYTPAAFQDTYAANQHLTNYGMAVTANVVAQYITRIVPGLPNRRNDPQWRALVSKFPK